MTKSELREVLVFARPLLRQCGELMSVSFPRGFLLVQKAEKLHNLMLFEQQKILSNHYAIYIISEISCENG